MPAFRFLRTTRQPTRSSAKAFGISVGVHAALAVILLVGFAAHSLTNSGPAQPYRGIIGSESRVATGGVASVAAPNVGPSLSPELGAQYVGRYRWPPSSRSTRFVDVHLINDGEPTHWSLAIAENQGALRTLNWVGQDSFVFQLAPEQRVVFRRVGELVSATSIRRGRDTSWAERETAR